MLRLSVLISLLAFQALSSSAMGAEGREKALVLPALTSRNSELESSVIEVLLTGGLEHSGLLVLDRRGRTAKCPQRNPLLDQARSKYLDLEMPAALELAETVRKEQLAAYGDLLGCAELKEAELFTVQIYLDVGERDKAFALALEILGRDANIRLDPAKFTPAVLAFWSEAVERVAEEPEKKISVERVSELAVRAGVDWVVVGMCWNCAVDGKPLQILAVPANMPERAYRGSVVLGTESQWAVRVRENLAVPFPPPIQEEPLVRPMKPVSEKEAGELRDEKAWYRTWWFWTIVGAVVVGGTAGAIGGYYSGTSRGSTAIESQLPW